MSNIELDIPNSKKDTLGHFRYQSRWDVERDKRGMLLNCTSCGRGGKAIEVISAAREMRKDLKYKERTKSLRCPFCEEAIMTETMEVKDVRV